MDEVQLMGPSLDTSAQLAGFRPKWSQSPNKTVWMSATIEPQWVQTVDHPDKPEVFSLNLSDSPKDSVLGKVVFAEKTLTKPPLPPMRTHLPPKSSPCNAKTPQRIREPLLWW